MAKPTKRLALTKSARTLPKGSKVVGAADPKPQIEISVRVRAKAGSELDDNALLALGAQQPSQRQYVSREEFAEKAGADPADIAKIDDFAHQHGLNVKSVHLESRTVKLTGSVKALSTAFGVKLQKVRYAGGTYRMRKGSVLIPPELKDIIVGVHGLDNRPVAGPHCRLRQAKRGAAAPRVAAGDGSFAVADVAKLYGFPTGVTGADQCIAIIELNSTGANGDATGTGYDAADLAAFFQGIGVPAPSVAAVSVDGGANVPGQDSDADQEVTLDI
jgi:kumamolisin